MTYEELAGRYDVPLCQGACAIKGHKRGFIMGGAVHWQSRRPYRLGLYRFLLLVAQIKLVRDRPDTPAERAWDRISWLHETHTWAQQRGFEDLSTRFPRYYSAVRRADARHLMSRYSREWPRPTEWERVRRWAKA